MGKLAEALKRKYPGGPREALKVLGLPEDLLNVKQLASDAKQRARKDAARRGMTIDEGGEIGEERDPHQDAFAALQRILTEVLPAGADRDAAMHHLETMLGGRVGRDGMADLGDEEERDESDEMSDEDRRQERRRLMSLLADFLAERKGMSEDEIGEALQDFPATGLEHFPLAEDLEDLMQERLEGMGSSGTSEYRKMPKAKDRKRRARDRKQAHDAYGLGRLEPKGNELLGYGDRESRRLAMDEERAARDADSFAQFFPDSVRIRTNSL